MVYSLFPDACPLIKLRTTSHSTILKIPYPQLKNTYQVRSEHFAYGIPIRTGN